MTITHVILDRDGVLNVEADGGWVLRVEDWEWQRGAQEALTLLGHDHQLSIATNQSCIGRGLIDAAGMDAVHAHLRLQAGVPFAGIHCCPHAPTEGCSCRKPAPGLLFDALAGTDPRHAVFVGDSSTDLQAARRAGVTPVLVRTGKGRATESSPAADGVQVFDDLLAFAHFLTGGGIISPADSR